MAHAGENLGGLDSADAAQLAANARTEGFATFGRGLAKRARTLSTIAVAPV